jgi:hypothetical protein
VSYELGGELPEVLLGSLHVLRGTWFLVGGSAINFSGNSENRLVIQESRALEN